MLYRSFMNDKHEHRPAAALLIAIFSIVVLLMGSTTTLLEHVRDAYAYKHRPPIVEKPARTETEQEANPLQIWMRVFLTLACLAASLTIILSSKYKPAEKHWAYGFVGTIIGYWFRGG
jgi:ABC-type Fe3+ transport system permease subunit